MRRAERPCPHPARESHPRYVEGAGLRQDGRASQLSEQPVPLRNRADEVEVRRHRARGLRDRPAHQRHPQAGGEGKG